MEEQNTTGAAQDRLGCPPPVRVVSWFNICLAAAYGAINLVLTVVPLQGDHRHIFLVLGPIVVALCAGHALLYWYVLRGRRWAYAGALLILLTLIWTGARDLIQGKDLAYSAVVTAISLTFVVVLLRSSATFLRYATQVEALQAKGGRA